MAMKLYSDTDVQAIANAIRTQNGETTQYKISEMAEAILDLSGSGSSVKTGTITPESRANQISVNIGMDSINGFMIMPSSESPWKSNGRTMGGLIIFKNPAGYWKRIMLNSNTAGSAALAPGLSTSTATNETISNGVLTVPNLNYAYETIEYRWWAW